MITANRNYLYLSFKIMACCIALSLLSGCGGCGKKAEPTSSVEQVKKDLEEGKLDEETALIFQVYSIYQDKKLPKKYRSKAPTREGDRIFNDVIRKWDTFKEETKQALEPYMVNPLDEKSHYMQNAKTKDFLVKNAYAAGPSTAGLNHYVTANNKVKIWYRNNEKKLAKWVLEAFNSDGIMEKEVTLMGRSFLSDNGSYGDDGKLDIFFKTMTDLGICHGAVTTTNKTYTYIELNKALNKKRMKSTVAHELFHSIHYNIDCFERTWWKEQTATWSEDFIYPTYNREHDYFYAYLENFNMRFGLRKEGSNHEYGSYVWPLYLTHKYGNSMIKKIWLAAEPEAIGALQALKNNIPGGFEEGFKEFALWIHHEKPIKKFKDSGNYLPVKPSKDKINIAAQDSIRMLADLEALALTIDHYYIKQQDKKRIRSVDFDLHEPLDSNPGLNILAIIKIANKEHVIEDWSGVEFRNFCFDFPEEDLEDITFVYINTDSVKKMSAVNAITVNEKEYGCEAKLDFSWSIQGQSGGNWEHTYKGSEIGKASMGSKQGLDESGQLNASFVELIIDLDAHTDDPSRGKGLVPASGSFSYNLKQNSSGSWAPIQGYGISGSSQTTCSASDSWDKKNKSKKGYATLRLEIIGPDKEEEIAQPDMNMIPPEMRQQMEAAMEMARNMGAQVESMRGQMESMGFSKGPQEGELKYKIRLYFDSLPSQFNVQMGGGEGSSEETTVTPDPIELEGIFEDTVTVIPLEKTINTSSGSARLQGTLILKPRQ